MKDIFKPTYAVVMTLPHESGEYVHFAKPGVVPGRIDTDTRASKKYRSKTFDDAVDMARHLRVLVPDELQYLYELYGSEDPTDVAARKAFADAYALVKFEVVELQPIRCTGEY